MFFLNPVTTDDEIIITAKERDIPNVVKLTIERETNPLLSFPDTRRFAIKNSKFKIEVLNRNKPNIFFKTYIIKILIQNVPEFFKFIRKKAGKQESYFILTC
jgi:hypothetical protein